MSSDPRAGYVCVAGNLGSGKSTLAVALSEALNVDVLTRSPFETSYVSDLFSSPGRWSFEAQVAFLAHRVGQVTEAIANGRSFILDRSFYEDRDIFARYFAESGSMDHRARATYESLATPLLENAPKPQLLIYCECSAATSQRRVRARRPRGYQALYPRGHVRRLAELYGDWSARLDELGVPVQRISTEDDDSLGHETVARIADQVRGSLGLRNTTTQQLSWIDSTEQAAPDESLSRPETRTRATTPWSERPPVVYIAAPYTFEATSATKMPHDKTLVDVDDIRTAIPDGTYRRQLTAVAEALKRRGFDVILPHRDINRWGRRLLTQEEVVKLCTEAVARADIFIGLLLNSYGVHLEAGVALGLGKAMILVGIRGGASTFVGKGMIDGGRATSLEVASLDELAAGIYRGLVERVLAGRFNQPTNG